VLESAFRLTGHAAEPATPWAATGAEGRSRRRPRLPEFVFAEYGAIDHLKADTLLTVNLVVAGHSVGATIFINALAEQPLERVLEAIVLIAAPFVGEGGWSSDEFELPKDLGARLPHGARVHVFHGLQDETVPPSHADLYAQMIPQARVHWLPGRDHQLNNDLSAVAKAISTNNFQGP
jgi:pimeloyl-ACP methyl ester carboxylesterase